jgi:hypothetical protein
MRRPPAPATPRYRVILIILPHPVLHIVVTYEVEIFVRPRKGDIGDIVDCHEV